MTIVGGQPKTPIVASLVYDSEWQREGKLMSQTVTDESWIRDNTYKKYECKNKTYHRAADPNISRGRSPCSETGRPAISVELYTPRVSHVHQLVGGREQQNNSPGVPQHGYGI